MPISITVSRGPRLMNMVGPRRRSSRFSLAAVGCLTWIVGCGLSQDGLRQDSGTGRDTPPETADGAAGGGAATGSGGAPGTGGMSETGGAPGSGGALGSGGAPGSGGISGTGGTPPGGTGGRAAGGTAGMGGRGGAGGRQGMGMGGRGGGAGGRGMSGGGGRGMAAEGGRMGAATGGGNGLCFPACTTGRACCGVECVNLQNDPFNCGACEKRCEGTTPYCAAGVCQPAPCSAATGCGLNATCCGNSCCGPGELCCETQGPISGAPVCHRATLLAPSCPAGCAPVCQSDRNIKKNITSVDAQQILAKVGRLPIASWTYVGEPASVRHLGPMAQDFYASFGLGDSDRSYHSVDGHGVALAAIQALNQLVEAERTRVQALEAENRALSRRIEALEKRPTPRAAAPRKTAAAHTISK